MSFLNNPFGRSLAGCRKIFFGFRLSVFGIVVLLLFFIYPLLVIKFLNPPPTLSELNQVVVKIKQVQEGSPTLKTVTADGVEMDFDLPPNGYTLVQGFPKARLLYNQKKELENCVGRISYDHMHFVFLRSPRRIWALDCGGVVISLRDSIVSYEKNNGWWIDGVFLAFGVFLCFMFCCGDWIKK